jgi:DivIVA domain-containing protein
LTFREVLEARFTATKFRDGYDQDEVDSLLDRVADALRPVHERRVPTPITRREVTGARFRATRWREGYDEAEVDAFLVRAADSLPG